MDNSKQIRELGSIVEEAVKNFNEKEKYLIENDLSERCMCARFALHLTKALQKTCYEEYEVDVEYNRGADEYERAIKRLNDPMITVDLVVHKRGYDCIYGFDNLICLEMKKSKDRRGCNSDENRLKCMTSREYGFNYKLGIMLVVDYKIKEMVIKSKLVDGEEIEL